MQMTDRTTGNHRTTTKLGDVIRWNNAAGEAVPAYGVVQLRTDYSAGYSQASKPNDTAGLFFANGQTDIASGGKGESLLWNRPRVVLLEAGVTVGTEVGPVSGSWSMSTDGTGFRVIHQPVAGVGTVVQVGGSGGGGGSGATAPASTPQAEPPAPLPPALAPGPRRQRRRSNRPQSFA